MPAGQQASLGLLRLGRRKDGRSWEGAAGAGAGAGQELGSHPPDMVVALTGGSLNLLLRVLGGCWEVGERQGNGIRARRVAGRVYEEDFDADMASIPLAPRSFISVSLFTGQAGGSPILTAAEEQQKARPKTGTWGRGTIRQLRKESTDQRSANQRVMPAATHAAAHAAAPSAPPSFFFAAARRLAFFDADLLAGGAAPGGRLLTGAGRAATAPAGIFPPLSAASRARLKVAAAAAAAPGLPRMWGGM